MMAQPAAAPQQAADLASRLAEAQHMLANIRHGQVDAVVVQGTPGERVYTLETADRPYRLLVERMQEGAATLSAAGDVLYCNPYLASLLGIDPAQATGQPLHRFVCPPDQAVLARVLSAPPGEREAVELQMQAQDGRAIPVNLSVVDLPAEPEAPRMMCAIITDLTLFQQRTRELRETVQRLHEATAAREASEQDRERLAMLVEESSDFISLLDLSGRPIYLNAAGRRMVGLTRSQVASGPGLAEYLMPQDHQRFTGEAVPAALAEGRWSGKMQLRHFVTGAPIPVTQDLFVLMNRSTERITNLATIARDMSDQERIEEQLRQSQKMEAVGHLTGGIAHDFNNLLTGIMGALELMQTRLAQGRFDTLDRYAQAASASAARAAAMTQRLLAFSRRQPLTPRAVDAAALVASMAELLRHTIGPQIQLTIVPGTSQHATLCDANQLENVLLNLAINARDAMPEGGRLEIACLDLDLDPDAARQRDIPPGAYIGLAVRDTGTGMTPEIIARAFDPFFTTKPLGQGTGLGLSMVYGFVKQSNGHVRIRSTVGTGTTIWLYLPRSGMQAAAQSPNPAPQPRSWTSNGETVLVVEDESVIRQLVMEILDEMGLRTIEAADGPAGLRALQSPAPIDLLVTDVGLPGLDGRQLAEAARAGRPGLKVLFMTGYADDPLFDSLDAEADVQMITKPFGIDALQSRVRAMIGRQAPGLA